MNPTLLFIILFLGVPLIIIALIVLSFVINAYDFQEVLTNGVLTKATIVDKYRRGIRPTRYWMVYEYIDRSGRTHQRKFTVFASECDRLQVGDSIDIEYSAKRPHISCLKETLDQSRAAPDNAASSHRDLSDESHSLLAGELTVQLKQLERLSVPVG